MRKKRLQKMLNHTKKEFNVAGFRTNHFVATGHRDYSMILFKGDKFIASIYFHPVAKEYTVAVQDDVALTRDTISLIQRLLGLSCEHFRWHRRQYQSIQKRRKKVWHCSINYQSKGKTKWQRDDL